jgi:hypothetical protein
MKCPHCDTGIHEALTPYKVIDSPAPLSLTKQPLAPPVAWYLHHQRCPECHRSIILLQMDTSGMWSGWPDLKFMAYPRSRSRPIPKEVLDPYRQDFSEACTVLADSAKASAALSRRCLQALLRDKVGTTKKDLYDQIEEVIAAAKLPSHILEGLHDVRKIGNIAAHSMKSTTTGAIVEVEPGEAEWNLDILESLFDFCFVQPALAAKRKADLEKKLKDIAKKSTP